MFLEDFPAPASDAPGADQGSGADTALAPLTITAKPIRVWPWVIGLALAALIVYLVTRKGVRWKG